MAGNRKPIDASYRWEVHSDTGRAILLERIAELDNGFAVEVSPIKRNDTKKQVGLYNGWIADISDFTGDDWSNIDKVIRRQFLPVIDEEVCGVVVRRLTKIRSLDEPQMRVLLDRLKAFSDQNIGAPLRDPTAYNKAKGKQ